MSALPYSKVFDLLSEKLESWHFLEAGKCRCMLKKDQIWFGIVKRRT